VRAAPVVRGDLKTLTRISIPLMLFFFCEAVALLFERIFLSYHSIEAVHGSLNGMYLASIFQTSCIAIGFMGQMFVGHYQGSNELKKVGKCIWQLIWFSFLSLLITLPLNTLLSVFYFKNSAIEHSGSQYFTILSLGNFLFPLSAALSSFYLGRGKTILVSTLMIISYGLNILFARLFIFGIEGMFPPLGVRGAALARCTSIGIFCVVFFGLFLSKKNRETYATHQWHFSPKALWEYVQPGFVRAFGLISARMCWAAICYFIIKKGGKYLDVITVGGTIVTFLIFSTQAIYRSGLTIASNLLGAKNYPELWRLCRSFLIYNSIVAAIFAIPILVFPNMLICFFDSSSQELFKETFGMIKHWIWFYLFALTMQTSVWSLLMSARDFQFQIYCYICFWLTSFTPIFFTIYLGSWQPDKLWLLAALESILFALIFFHRFCQRRWEKTSFNPRIHQKNEPI